MLKPPELHKMTMPQLIEFLGDLSQMKALADARIRQLYNEQLQEITEFIRREGGKREKNSRQNISSKAKTG